MPGRKSKSKGYRGERGFVDDINKSPSFRARRQPGSGAYPGYPDDLVEEKVLRGTIEVKYHETLAESLWKWLGIEVEGRKLRRVKDVKALLLKKNWHPGLIVMELDAFLALIEEMKRDAGHSV